MKNKLSVALLLLMVSIACHAQQFDHKTISNATIGFNETMELVDDDCIVLTNGFHAEEGADFHAYISDREPQKDLLEGKSYFSTKQSGLAIYPNPCYENFSVKLADASNQIKHISIFYPTGSQLIEIAYPLSNDLDVSSLASGIYIIKVITSSGEVYYQKLMKN